MSVVFALSLGCAGFHLLFLHNLQAILNAVLEQLVALTGHCGFISL